MSEIKLMMSHDGVPSFLLGQLAHVVSFGRTHLDRLKTECQIWAFRFQVEYLGEVSRLHSRNIGSTHVQEGALGEEPSFPFHPATKNTSHAVKEVTVIVSPRFEAAWLYGCSEKLVHAHAVWTERGRGRRNLGEVWRRVAVL